MLTLNSPQCLKTLYRCASSQGITLYGVTVLYRQFLRLPLQAQENLREERRQGAGLQQQLAQMQEAAQGSAQSAMQLDAQAKQLATQLQHSQATSHTLQKLIQV